jgi:geranylgeranyl pyrophosphate synthase
MFVYKHITRSFSQLSTKTVDVSVPQTLIKYKSLLEKASYISEGLFPKKINSIGEFRKYLKVEELSKNISLDSNRQLESFNSGILTPCWDLISRGGKQWRPILGLMIGKYFNIEIEEIERNNMLYKVLAMTELIHNASLIIDDVEDKSEQRRNEPCVHIKYGEDIALNAGITMLYLPIYKMMKEIPDKIKKSDLAEVYFEELTAIHLGQGWDIEMKVERRIPSFDNYKDTVMFKTGVCPRLIVKSIKVLVDDKQHDSVFQEFIDIVDNVSIAFQIRDDVLNISPSNLAKGKGFLGEDIFEGKLSLMVLHTLNSSCNNKERLKNILQMKTKDKKLINEAIDILNVNKSIEFADEQMNKHVQIAEEKCHRLTTKAGSRYNNKAVEEIVELVRYLIYRNN